MINKWIINEPVSRDKPVGCVIALPGRGIPGTLMEKFMEHTGLWRTLVVVLEPHDKEWYPAPNGPKDQAAAVAGLPFARAVIEDKIEAVQRIWGLKRNEIGVLGFSAGGVMVNYLLSTTKNNLAGGVCLAGAILDPHEWPKAPTDTPLLVQHNRDDMCFEWGERFLPMKEALVDGGYNVDFVERWDGGHNLSYHDVRITRDFFAKKFGYYDDFEVIEEEEAEKIARDAEDSTEQ